MELPTNAECELWIKHIGSSDLPEIHETVTTVNHESTAPVSGGRIYMLPISPQSEHCMLHESVWTKNVSVKKFARRK